MRQVDQCEGRKQQHPSLGGVTGVVNRWKINDAESLFLLAVAVALEELVDASCGVDEFLLAGKEGVRRAGDLELHQGIGYAINLDSLFAVDGRASDEHLFVRHVFERHFAIVGGMQIFLHFDISIFTINILMGVGKHPVFCNGVQRYKMFLDYKNIFDIYSL